MLPAPGQVLLFSGAQLHNSIPNTSGRARFSVDFRTVYMPDLMAGRGAPLVDVNCTGTAIRDFINVADESRFDEETGEGCSGRRRTVRCSCSAPPGRRPDRRITTMYQRQGFQVK